MIRAGAVGTPRILFLGLTYAGHETRFDNLESVAGSDERISPSFRRVSGWKSDGLFERLPLLPAGVRGRLRATAEASAYARLPRPDIVWSSVSEVLTPFLVANVGPFRRPLVLDLDCTLAQLEGMAPDYFGRPSRSGARIAFSYWNERRLWRHVTKFLPWSNWAAAGLTEAGISSDRIEVIPPGVDLHAWQPTGKAPLANRPLRALFVGGDFLRKGGDLVLAAVTGPLKGRIEVDVVTRDAVATRPGVRVHRLEANTPALRELYARADLFLLPTRADCFGIAAVEAMASGLPVIMGDVGAAREIVSPGDTGWVIPATQRALDEALESAWSKSESLGAMGERARMVAEKNFDLHKNNRRTIDMLIGLSEGLSGVAP